MKSKLAIGMLLATCVATAWLIATVYKLLLNALEASGTLLFSDMSWVFQLSLNMVGFSTVLLPCFIVYKYLERTNYFDKLNSPTCMSRALFACFGEPGERLPETRAPPSAGAGAGVSASGGGSGSGREGAELMLCFTGLMGAYLVWGLLQEKIMTQSYTMSDGSFTKFSDSQFLVFINRLSALCVAVGRLTVTRTPLHAAPLYKFSYCSLTNVMSAWCQYEALKYVSFPTQVLSKSCKVIPVMVMSRLVGGPPHALHDYVSAGFISLGAGLFMLGAHQDFAVSSVMTASGLSLLALYLVCDSFTSSWQGRLFSRYHVTPLQMMYGVNLFSCLLTGVSLLQHPSTVNSIALLAHPVFLTDCVLLSASSALGQLLIYRTIARFGPVVFTIIMTVRQATSILLSCLVYGHAISGGGFLGAVLVFTGVLLRLYCRRRLRAARAQPDRL